MSVDQNNGSIALGRRDDFELERYKYILQQLHTVNENVYRFLGIYQALTTALLGVGLALFVGYAGWGISPAAARSGITVVLWLITVIAAFAVLLILAGLLSWLDYRKEECELAKRFVGDDFRSPPSFRNFYRWYETYVVLFIIISVIFMWCAAWQTLLPSIE